MYRKYTLLLLFCNMLFFLSLFSLRLIEGSRLAATPAFRMQLLENRESGKETSQLKQMERADSGQRVIDYERMERKLAYDIDEEDYQILCRIVEAEAGGEDFNGRLLVANVVLNRVDSAAFPDTVQRVVFQKDRGVYQFSPIRDGRYQRVSVSEETRKAVDSALLGEDISRGALYFVSRKAADPAKMKWFDQNLELLLTYGGHEFFG